MMIATILYFLVVILFVMILGYFFFSWIVNSVTLEFTFSASKADRLCRRSEQMQRKEIRSSKVFKNRLAAVLKAIKEESLKNNNSLKIAYIESCKTDQQIKNILEERKFDTCLIGNNGLRITW